MKQVVTVERPARLVGEHEIFGFAKFRVPRPHPLYGRKNHAMPIEWHLALSSFRLHVVELVVVDSFVDDDAIVKDVIRDKLSLTPRITS
jgi:hypothetical protein